MSRIGKLKEERRGSLFLMNTEFAKMIVVILGSELDPPKKELAEAKCTERYHSHVHLNYACKFQ